MSSRFDDAATRYWTWIALAQGNRADRLEAEAMGGLQIDDGVDVNGVIIEGGADAIALLEALVHAAPADESATAQLGAGPLESFLHFHATDEAAIAALCASLRRLPRLRAALVHVWGDVPEPVARLR